MLIDSLNIYSQYMYCVYMHSEYIHICVYVNIYIYIYIYIYMSVSLQYSLLGFEICSFTKTKLFYCFSISRGFEEKDSSLSQGH